MMVEVAQLMAEVSGRHFERAMRLLKIPGAVNFAESDEPGIHYWVSYSTSRSDDAFVFTLTAVGCAGSGLANELSMIIDTLKAECEATGVTGVTQTFDVGDLTGRKVAENAEPESA